MSIRSHRAGHLYLISNDFPVNHSVTLTSSTLPPEEFLKQLNKARKSDKWMIEVPSEILFHLYLENCSQVEGQLHQFLIEHNFCAGAPKDYQLGLKAMTRLVHFLLDHGKIDSELIPLKSTQIFPAENCNYYLMGKLFRIGPQAQECLIHPYSDDGAAFSCFKKGVELGDDKCLSEVALCYEHGLGVTACQKKALDYYTQSYALFPFKAVNGVYRLLLKSGDTFAALGIFEHFLLECSQKSQEHKYVSTQSMLAGHKTFVDILAHIALDTYLHWGDFEWLRPHQDIFNEFSYSIEKCLNGERVYLEGLHVEQLAQRVAKCVEAFKNTFSVTLSSAS